MIENEDPIGTIFKKELFKHLKDKNITQEKLDKISQKIIEESSKVLFRSLISMSKEPLKYQREIARGFNERLKKRYKKSFKLIEIFLHCSTELGKKFNEQTQKKTSKEKDLVTQALIRIHARACLTGFEIVTLLENGLADGAHARWRTLHELSVIACFIKQHGSDIAKRFLDYGIIEQYQETITYQEHCKSLGYEPFDNKYLNQMKKKYLDMCRKYGKGFGGEKKQYGWIPSDILKDKTFEDIEKSVKLDKFRPFYKMSCHNIHVGAKSLFFRLGLLPKNKRKQLILAGPSNYGLADPAQCMVISLNHINACLLLNKPNFTNAIQIDAMLRLSDEVCKSFVEAQKKIEDEEVNLRK